jgi:hypothetical protein
VLVSTSSPLTFWMRRFDVRRGVPMMRRSSELGSRGGSICPPVDPECDFWSWNGWTGREAAAAFAP